MCDQAAGLRRRLAFKKDAKQAKAIAVVSGKGGVGKSSISLNFSLELLRREKKVLLMDMDIGMGNIDILLGLNPKYTVMDMFIHRLSIHDIIETGPNGLAYIAGGSALNTFFTMDQTRQEYFFQQFGQLTELYDYIIFDMGAGATNDSLFFITAADECIVVTTPEPTSITDAYSMIKHIVNNRNNLPIYIIMNRSTDYKKGEKALERFQHVIWHFLHKEVHMMGILPDDKIVSTAVTKQKPFTMLNEKAGISKALKALVENYLYGKPMPNKQAAFSFVERLRNMIAR